MRSWALLVELSNPKTSVVACISQGFQDLVLVANFPHDLRSIHVSMTSFEQGHLVLCLVFLKEIFDLLIINFYHTNFDFVLYSILLLFYNIINFVNSCKVKSWIFVITNHGVSFSRSCLSITHDANIVSLHWRLNKVFNLIKDIFLSSILIKDSVKPEFLTLVWVSITICLNGLCSKTLNRALGASNLWGDNSTENSDVSSVLLQLRKELSSSSLLLIDIRFKLWVLLL